MWSRQSRRSGDGQEGAACRWSPPRKGAEGARRTGRPAGGCSAGLRGSGGSADVIVGREKPVKGARGQSCCVTLLWVTGRRNDRDRVGVVPVPLLQAGKDEPGPGGHGGQRRR